MLKKSRPNRRQFLTSLSAVGVASVAAPLVLPRHLLAQSGAPGPNDTVKVGLIGLGGRCTWIYPGDLKPAAGLRVAAICDFWPKRITDFMKKFDGDFTFRDKPVILILGVHANLLDFCDENFQGIITCSPFLYLPNLPNFNTSK